MELRLEVIPNNLGQVVLHGYFKENSDLKNELKFEMESDQSFLSSSLKDLSKFVKHYGDSKGIKI
ncbi:hypothetical protein MKZ01_14025 [Lysinibacillus endophyticus]|uniref:hypothetical protein n=1 Tax=Ureibacillus endophyticus TaxID=1978490 RepID=UPI0031351EC4